MEAIAPRHDHNEDITLVDEKPEAERQTVVENNTHQHIEKSKTVEVEEENVKEFEKGKQFANGDVHVKEEKQQNRD